MLLVYKNYNVYNNKIYTHTFNPFFNGKTKKTLTLAAPGKRFAISTLFEITNLQVDLR